MYIIFYACPYLIRFIPIKYLLDINMIWVNRYQFYPQNRLVHVLKTLKSKFSEVVSNVGVSFSLEGQSQNKICYHKIMQAKFNTLTIYDIRHICIWWGVVLYAHLYHNTIIAPSMHKCHPNICWS